MGQIKNSVLYLLKTETDFRANSTKLKGITIPACNSAFGGYQVRKVLG